MPHADRDALLRAYLDGAAQLADALAAMPPECLDHRPKPGAWTNREILVHLADAEVEGYVRCRIIIAEPGGTLLNLDQDAWCNRLAYSETAPGPAAELFGQLRRINHTLLSDLPSEVWSQSATHNVSGPMTLDEWLAGYVDHLTAHLAQLEANEASWRRVGF